MTSHLHKKIFGLLLLPLLSSVPTLAVQYYKPDNLNASTANIVVVIHGCLQSAESMALGTGFNQLADHNGFLVVYPQIAEGSNLLGCWNWFFPENQRADSGQLKQVMDQIHDAKVKFGLKNPDVFVTGISSGAATVAGLLACFPGEFKAGAIHSGPSYGLAKTQAEGERVLREGPGNVTTSGPCHPKDFRGSLLVIQGTADVIVNPTNAQRIVTDFKGASTRLEMVKGLGHAWAGSSANLRYKELLEKMGALGVTKVPFFSDAGPNATAMMWDSFSKARSANKSQKD